MKFRNFLRFLLVALIVAISLLGFQKTQAQDQEEARYVPGQIMIGWKTRMISSSTEAKDPVFELIDGEELEQIPEIRLSIVRIPEGTELAAIEILQSDAVATKVAYAELDEMQEPPRFHQVGAQGWEDYWNTQQIELERALNHVGSTPYAATIALVDTGTSYHQELTGRVLSGYAVSGGDPHDPSCGDPYYDGHGNACASLAAGQGISVKGVCPMCLIYPIKMYYPRQGTCIGYTSEAVEGITHAANQGSIDIIAAGWAGTTNSSSLRNAVNYAASKGKTVVAPRGNANSSTNRYPAVYSGVLAVIASDEDNLRVKTPKHSWGSSYGKSEDQKMVSAPGAATIRSAWQGNTSYIDDMGGTSAAYPQAAGLAGLLKSESPAMTRVQLIAAVENGCDDIETVACGSHVWDQQSGHGRINVARSVGLDGNPMIIDYIEARVVTYEQQPKVVTLSVTSRDRETCPLTVSITVNGTPISVSRTDFTYWGSWTIPKNNTEATICYPLNYGVTDATSTVTLSGNVCALHEGAPRVYLPIIMKNY